MSEDPIDNGNSGDSGLRAELKQLNETVQQLSARIVRLERLEGIRFVRDDEAEAHGAVSAAARASGLLLSRIGAGSFVLVGALILRTITRQAWVAPIVGTALGMLYCGALMIIPRWLERQRPAWRQGELVEIAGALLVPLIVLEMVHRVHAIGIVTASLSLTAAALLGSITGYLRGSAVGVALTLLAQVAAIAGLGFTPQHAVWRAGALVAVAALALWIAHRHDWPFLRPLVLTPIATLLLLAVGATAFRPAYTTIVAWPATYCALAVWLLVITSSVVRADKLDSFERTYIPAASLWLYVVFAFMLPTTVRWVATVAACGLLLLLALPGSGPRRKHVTPSLIATAALLLLPSLPLIDPTGLALAGAAVLIQVIGTVRHPGYGATLSQVMVLAAIALNLYHGRVFELEHKRPWPTIGTGSILALLLLLHYIGMVWLQRGRQLTRLIAPLSLAGAALMTALALRLAAHTLARNHSLSELVLTVSIAALGLAALAAGRRWKLRSPTHLGWVAVIAVALKVVAWDMMHIDGAALVGSVLTLGVVATVVSLMQRSKGEKAR